MHHRLTIRFLLCTLIVAAHTHCVLAHGHELLREVQAIESAELPIEDTAPCENESGCICKGATLAEHVELEALGSDLGQWFTFETMVVRFDSMPPSHSECCTHFGPELPPNATAARVLLQSFQI